MKYCLSVRVLHLRFREGLRMLPPSCWQGRMSHKLPRKHFVDLHGIFGSYIAYTNHASHVFSACDELVHAIVFSSNYQNTNFVP